LLLYNYYSRLWNHPGCLVIKSKDDENRVKRKETKKIIKSKISMKVVEKELSLPFQIYMSGGGDKDVVSNSQFAGSLFSGICDNKGSNNAIDISDSSSHSSSDCSSDRDSDTEDVDGFQLNCNYPTEHGDSNDSSIHNLNDESNNSVIVDTGNDDINQDTIDSIIQEEVDNNWWKSLSTNESATTNTSSSSSSSSTSVLNGNMMDLPLLSNDIFQGEMLNLGNKIILFLSLLALSIDAGDKVLLFSQSLDTLNFIELCLQSDNWGVLIGVSSNKVKLTRWRMSQQYFRLDGSTGDRQKLIDKFNKNSSTHLFLISTKAGNMGINLQSANRVVIFDTSWNPAHDLQAIFRSYRYGQQKNVFVYRFIASGSMEEKIYKKQVIKQTLSVIIIY
jgi:SNF2 family DNA or RNA helicase